MKIPHKNSSRSGAKTRRSYLSVGGPLSAFQLFSVSAFLLLLLTGCGTYSKSAIEYARLVNDARSQNNQLRMEAWQMGIYTETVTNPDGTQTDRTFRGHLPALEGPPDITTVGREIAEGIYKASPAGLLAGQLWAADRRDKRSHEQVSMMFGLTETVSTNPTVRPPMAMPTE